MENTSHTMAWQIGDIAGAVGRGLLAGLAGTAAMTVSQMIEMKITGREASNTPAEAVEKVMPVETENEAQKESLSQLTHFAYGTAWGVPRALIDQAGLHGWAATALHLGAVWGTEQVMLPGLKISPPITQWGAKAITTDLIHHTVYAVAAGLVYDRIRKAAKA